MANSILNISVYKFVRIDNAEQLRLDYLHHAQQQQLKGTILIAEEGINIFLAGFETHIRSFVQWLTSDSRFSDLQPKESWSKHQPFAKLLVKVKNEIIRMNHPAIQPQQGRAPAISPATVKKWLDQGHDDEGRPVVTLDTRNGFEVGHGKFKNAIDYNISKFSEFPTAVLKQMGELQDKTVISYCTGGIRCEKAAIFMRKHGHQHVFQIDGGILKYFEEVGDHHYEGACFVFDEREALDSELKPIKA